MTAANLALLVFTPAFALALGLILWRAFRSKR